MQWTCFLVQRSRAWKSRYMEAILSVSYCRGDHAWHSGTLTGEVRGGPVLKRITPSEVEQKLFVPSLAPIGVPTATKFLQGPCRQMAVTRNRNPDFAHHVPTVQLALPSVASMKLACSAEEAPVPRG